jgi:hypothetical protein
MPCVHGWHVGDAGSLEEPTAQSTQAVDPAAGAERPAAQSVQADRPDVMAKRPASPAVQNSNRKVRNSHSYCPM